MKATCAYCGCRFEILTGAYNRSLSKGLNVYCNRAHAGIGRRVEKSVEQKREEKSQYDRLYRDNNKSLIKEKHAAYHRETYNPQRAAEKRKLKMPKHIEYCRQPKYVEYKQAYDKQYRAKRLYGEFAEAAIVLIELEKILESRQIKYDTGVTLNKSSQKRKRTWQQLQNLKN